MDPEQDISVGVIEVAEVHQPAGEPLQGVGVTAQVGAAGGGDLGRHLVRCRPAVGLGLLLHVAPEVGLDVDDDRLAISVGEGHQQLEVGVVGGHRRSVVQVAVVLVQLVAPDGRIRLKKLVVREHRDVARASRGAVGHVPGGELACRRVPRLPAAAGIHTTAQVLVAVAPGHLAGRHPAEICGAVGKAEMKPVGGQRRGDRSMRGRQLVKRDRQ